MTTDTVDSAEVVLPRVADLGAIDCDVRPRSPGLRDAGDQPSVGRRLRQVPELPVVCVESGISWLFGVTWRVAKDWRGARMEVPWIKESPAEIMQSRLRLTTAPFDAPPEVEDGGKVVELVGSPDMLLYATDFPHDHGASSADGRTPSRLRSIRDWSSEMDQTVLEKDCPQEQKAGIVDCDIPPGYSKPGERTSACARRTRSTVRCPIRGWATGCGATATRPTAARRPRTSTSCASSFSTR